jgi:hypothetical protein
MREKVNKYSLVNTSSSHKCSLIREHLIMSAAGMSIQVIRAVKI